MLRVTREFGFDFRVPLVCLMRNLVEATFGQDSLPPRMWLKQEVFGDAGAVTVCRRFRTPTGSLADVTWIPTTGRESGVSHRLFNYGLKWQPAG